MFSTPREICFIAVNKHYQIECFGSRYETPLFTTTKIYDSWFLGHFIIVPAIKSMFDIQLPIIIILYYLKKIISRIGLRISWFFFCLRRLFDVNLSIRFFMIIMKLGVPKLSYYIIKLSNTSPDIIVLVPQLLAKSINLVI